MGGILVQVRKALVVFLVESLVTVFWCVVGF